MRKVDKKDFSTFIKPLKDTLEMVEVKESKPLTIEYKDKESGEIYAKICRCWEPTTRTITMEHYIRD